MCQTEDVVDDSVEDLHPEFNVPLNRTGVQGCGTADFGTQGYPAWRLGGRHPDPRQVRCVRDGWGGSRTCIDSCVHILACLLCLCVFFFLFLTLRYFATRGSLCPSLVLAVRWRSFPLHGTALVFLEVSLDSLCARHSFLFLPPPLPCLVISTDGSRQHGV